MINLLEIFNDTRVCVTFKTFTVNWKTLILALWFAGHRVMSVPRIPSRKTAARLVAQCPTKQWRGGQCRCDSSIRRGLRT